MVHRGGNRRHAREAVRLGGTISTGGGGEAAQCCARRHRLEGMVAPTEAKVESEAGVHSQVSGGSATGGWCPPTL